MPDEVQQVGPHAQRTSKGRSSGKCQLMVLKAKTAGVVHIVCNHNYLSWQKNIKKSYTVDTNLYDFQYFHFLSIFHSVFVVTNSPFGRLKRLNWEASLLRPTHGVPLLACETWGPRATRSFKLYIYIHLKKNPLIPARLYSFCMCFWMIQKRVVSRVCQCLKKSRLFNHTYLTLDGARVGMWL